MCKCTPSVVIPAKQWVSSVPTAPHICRVSEQDFQWGCVVFVFVIFDTERKAESYLLANLNDMFLQQNQTKKQWKWGSEVWGIWMDEQKWGDWNHQQGKGEVVGFISYQTISVPHLGSVTTGGTLLACLRAIWTLTKKTTTAACRLFLCESQQSGTYLFSSPSGMTVTQLLPHWRANILHLKK